MEMARMKVNILLICKTKWIRAGNIIDDEHVFVFSRGKTCKSGEGVFLNKNTA